MAHERKCIICGKEYQYCHKCKQYASLPRWYSEFCSENCKNVYDATNKFSFGHIDAKEAKQAIGNLTGKDVVTAYIAEIIDTINATTVVEEKVESVVVEEEKPKKKSVLKKAEKEIVNED